MAPEIHSMHFSDATRMAAAGASAGLRKIETGTAKRASDHAGALQ